MRSLPPLISRYWIVGWIVLASASPAIGGCFDLSKPQSQPTLLSGQLELRIFPGPPNYENIKTGDTPESAYILQLAKPICIQGSGFADGKPFTTVHLLPIEGKVREMKALVGQEEVKVRLRDSFGAQTGHHHAPLVASVQSIAADDPDPTNEYGTAATTIRGFYLALQHGLGEEAAQFIVPEKRKGAFEPAAMSRFYGGLAEPIVLDSIDKLGDASFHVTYRYRAGKAACNGAAQISTTKNRQGEFLIQSIKPLNGC